MYNTLCRHFLLLTQMRLCMSLVAHGCLCEAWERMTWMMKRRTVSLQPVCLACPSWIAALLIDPVLPLTPDRLHQGNALPENIIIWWYICTNSLLQMFYAWSLFSEQHYICDLCSNFWDDFFLESGVWQIRNLGEFLPTLYLSTFLKL